MKMTVYVEIPVWEVVVKNGKEVVEKQANKVLKDIQTNHAQGKDALGRAFNTETGFSDTRQMIDSIEVQVSKGKNPRATIRTKGKHQSSGLTNDALLKIHAAPQSEKKNYPPALFIAADKETRNKVKEEGASELDVELRETGRTNKVPLV